MRITTKTPEQFTGSDIDQLAHLAGIGFGQGDSEEMYQDSVEHIRSSELVQLAHSDNELIAFSMIQSCLWRQSTGACG